MQLQMMTLSQVTRQIKSAELMDHTQNSEKPLRAWEPRPLEKGRLPTFIFIEV